MNPGGISNDDVRATENEADRALFSKIGWRLMPLLIVCYMVAFLDRINIGFAQLQMKETLPFNDAAYAFGAGIFFAGYFLFGVPSNLLLEKIGARKTLLCIMFCWGIVAASTVFVHTAIQFYVVRFLLGAFEAGFFPGVILYLTYWCPGRRRGSFISIFMAATTIAYLLAGPLCGGIMKYMDGMLGYRGWQWLFVVQGLPASLLGIVAYLTLRDEPEQAEWLTPDEKVALRKHLDSDTSTVAGAAHGSLLALLGDPRIFILSLVYCLYLGAIYAMIFWTPTLIKSWGVADVFMVGVLSTIPNLAGIVGMVVMGRSSDRHRERRWHFAATMALAAAGVFLVILSQGYLPPSLAGMAILSIGQSAATPLFFAAASEYLPKKTAAAGIALISSLGNLGPLFMPSITTWLRSMTHGPTASLCLVMLLFLLSGTLLSIVMRPARQPLLERSDP